MATTLPGLLGMGAGTNPGGTGGGLLDPGAVAWNQFASNIGSIVGGRRPGISPQQAAQQALMSNATMSYQQAMTAKMRANLLEDEEKRKAKKEVMDLQAKGQPVPASLAESAGFSPSYYAMGPYQQQQIDLQKKSYNLNAAAAARQQAEDARKRQALAEAQKAISGMGTPVVTGMLNPPPGAVPAGSGAGGFPSIFDMANRPTPSIGPDPMYQAAGALAGAGEIPSAIGLLKQAQTGGKTEAKTIYERMANVMTSAQQKQMDGIPLTNEELQDLAAAQAYFGKVQRFTDPQGNISTVTQPAPVLRSVMPGASQGGPAPGGGGVLGGLTSAPQAQVLAEAAPKKGAVESATFHYNRARDLVSGKYGAVAGPAGKLQSEFGGAMRSMGIPASVLPAQLDASLEALKMSMSPELLQERGIGLSDTDRRRVDAILGSLDWFKNDDIALRESLDTLKPIMQKYRILEPEKKEEGVPESVKQQLLNGAPSVKEGNKEYRLFNGQIQMRTIE